LPEEGKIMAETTDPAIPAAPAEAPRRAPVLPMVTGGFLAAALGFGAALMLPKPVFDPSALQSQLDAQKADLAEARSAAPKPDPELSARLDALEQALAALQSRPAADFDATGLQSQIDALKAGALPAPAMADLSAAIDAKLAERLASAEASLQSLKSDAEAATSRAALLQVQAALDSGAPFASILAAVSLPAALADHAATGLPSLQSLRSSFPEAARAGLDAALAADMGDSWAERATAFLRGQTGARSLTPREGSDPDAVLSRAEAALSAADLPTALTELSALPPEAQVAMSGWLDKARLRQSAVDAMQSLIATSQ
jgi:hypothetical protein